MTIKNYNFERGYKIFEKKLNILFQKIGNSLKIGVACSGGPDSILLIHYLAYYKSKNLEKIKYIIIIHIIDGHYIVESSLKETMEKARDLVIHQSNFYNFKYIIYNNTNIEKFNKKISIETLCHEIRKKYFLESIKEYNLDRILTGHTLTDQLEHFFIGIIRHSSIKRISGMQEDSFIYFRPLLFMHKQNTKLILDQIKQEYVLDPCNNNNYLRNNLRNKLISMLNKIDDRFENGILSTMKQLYEFEKIIQQATNNELKKNDIYQIDYFLNLQPIIQQKTIEKLLYANNFFKEVSLNLCEEIIRFLKTKEGGEHKIKTIIIIKKQNEWKIINNI